MSKFYLDNKPYLSLSTFFISLQEWRDIMKTKICRVCGKEKPIEECEKRENLCKKCKKIYNQNYRKNNLERIKKQKEKSYQQNCEKIKEKSRKYYSENIEKMKNTQRKYRDKNREIKIEYNKKYYKENKEKLKEQKKEYYNKNIEKIKITKQNIFIKRFKTKLVP